MESKRVFFVAQLFFHLWFCVKLEVRRNAPWRILWSTQLAFGVTKWVPWLVYECHLWYCNISDPGLGRWNVTETFAWQKYYTNSRITGPVGVWCLCGWVSEIWETIPIRGLCKFWKTRHSTAIRCATVTLYAHFHVALCCLQQPFECCAEWFQN